MGIGLQEGEIKQGIAAGGHVRNVLIVSKCVGTHVEHQAYIRPSWKRDFLPMRTWGDEKNRTYRDLDRLLMLIRIDFKYVGVIPLYITGAPELARYKALLGLEGAPPTGRVPPHCDDGPCAGPCFGEGGEKAGPSSD